jgi:hypothetical protein
MVVPSLNIYTNYMHEKYILKATVRPDHGRYNTNCFTASINPMIEAEKELILHYLNANYMTMAVYL